MRRAVLHLGGEEGHHLANGREVRLRVGLEAVQDDVGPVLEVVLALRAHPQEPRGHEQRHADGEVAHEVTFAAGLDVLQDLPDHRSGPVGEVGDVVVTEVRVDRSAHAPVFLGRHHIRGHQGDRQVARYRERGVGQVDTLLRGEGVDVLAHLTDQVVAADVPERLREFSVHEVDRILGVDPQVLVPVVRLVEARIARIECHVRIHTTCIDCCKVPPVSATRRTGPVAPKVLAVRRERRRARVVKRLLRVVEELLEDEDSYHELTVERILEEDGMARSTFYSYFEDKVALLAALAESVLGEIVEGSQAIWTLPPGASRDEVGAAVSHTIETYLPHTRLMNAVVEVATYDARVRKQFREGYGEAQAAAARYIRNGQAAGTIRADLDVVETAGWFTWMAERGMTQLVQGASRAKLRKLEASFTAILWYTLYDGQRD